MNQTERAILAMIKAELQCSRTTRKTLLKIYARIESGEYMRQPKESHAPVPHPETDSSEA